MSRRLTGGAIARVALFAAASFAFAAAAVAASGPAHLLKDVNSTPSRSRGSSPEMYQRLGSVELFHAYTPRTGIELWKTDGTEAGTQLVKDINPGRGGSFNYPGADRPDEPYVALGDALLFLADDGLHGFELWRTDGTEAGTRMVKDIWPGSRSAFAALDFSNQDKLFWQTVKAQGFVYFPAHDGDHGFELWRTDGTEAGTFLLRDIYPGFEGALDNFNFTVPFAGAGVGGSFIFRALDPVHGLELWKTDGTPAGTLLVKDIFTGPSDSYPDAMLASGGKIFFSADDGAHGVELWSSDGTSAGTALVQDINPAPAHTDSYPRPLAEVNGVVLFAAAQPCRLYRTDGTQTGTSLIRTFDRGLYPVQVLNGSLLFVVDDGSSGTEPWRTDGTPEGTSLVKDINPGPAGSFGSLTTTELAGRLYFFADDGVHGSELWSTDGTGAGTSLVKEMTPGSSGTSAVVSIADQGNLFFMVEDSSNFRLWVSDGSENGTRPIRTPMLSGAAAGFQGKVLFGGDEKTHGVELWKSDGTDAGTGLLKDVNPSFVTDTSYARILGAAAVPGIGDRIFLSADDGTHGVELWASDGTEGGTALVKDIYPGLQSSIGSHGITHDGAIYFEAIDAEHGGELWKSDGTEAGTVLVEDIAPGQPSSMLFASTFVEFKGSIHFAADDGVHGRTLWRSDGTLAGTAQVAPVDLKFSFQNAGTSLLDPLAVGGSLFFGANDPARGLELWKTDGTEPGTALVKDIAPGGFSSGPSSFAELNGRLFLAASDSVHGNEPYISDGTEPGTFLLKDIFPGRSASQRKLQAPVAWGGYVFFPAISRTNHEDIWKTDGTEAGTTLVRDLHPNDYLSNVSSLAVWRGALFFTSCSSVTCELWKSDGSEEGTRVIKSGLLDPCWLLALEDGLLFTAGDDEHGEELWRSDGTEEGTLMVQDLAPGPDSSIPNSFTPMGKHLVFLATDDIAGADEPWIAHTAIVFGRPAQAIQDLRAEVQALRLPRGIDRALTAMLDSAAEALSARRATRAIIILETFSRFLDALSRARIPEATTGHLQLFASDLVSLLEDSPFPASHPKPQGTRPTTF